MKAMYLEDTQNVVEKDIPKPEIEPDEVLVEMKSVGICGSDMEYFEKGRIGEFVVEEPIVLGHESAGVVAEIGNEVDDLEAGDEVALEPGVPCRRCKYCKTGHYNLCPDVEFMATPPIDGAFVEYYAHPSDFAYKLPESVSLDEGAMIEPLSVGLYAARRAKIQPGDSVAVLGAGPIGLVSLQAALVYGATDIYVTDIIDYRLDKARELGATKAVNVREDSLDRSDFDSVLQTAGTAGTFKQAISLSRRGGRAVQVGYPSTTELTIDPTKILSRELDLVGVHRYMDTYPRAISLLESGRVDVESMISKSFSLDEVEEALRYPKQNPDECIKAIVNI